MPPTSGPGESTVRHVGVSLSEKRSLRSRLRFFAGQWWQTIYQDKGDSA